MDFVVGKSNPAKDWHATQAIATGPKAVKKGGAFVSDPWTVHVELGKKSVADYKLNVAVLIENSCVIRLFDFEKKIELVEEVNKLETSNREGIYFAFPFAMKEPRFQYEIQNGVVNPAEDMNGGAGREWFSVRHWVSAEENGMAATLMPLDAPLVTLGDINRGNWPQEFGHRPGTIFSYVMSNYWNTNYRARQGGSFRFRYVITSGPSINAAQLSRLGWEEVTPFETDMVTDQDQATSAPRVLDGTQESFVKVDDPKLLLETWKPAEDGNGSIMRFLDLGGEARTVSVQLQHQKIKQVWLTDSVERPLEPLTLAGDQGFDVSIRTHGIVTVRILSSVDLQTK